MLRLALVSVVMGVAAGGAMASPAPSAPSSVDATGCVLPAARFHRVNSAVLAAILAVESGSNPGAIGRNANGTVDLGIGQINSIHLAELKKFGIGPAHLLTPCIGTYVAAWHLSRQYARYGNTWFAIGAYHSTTPELNLRYQMRVYGQIRRMGTQGTQ